MLKIYSSGLATSIYGDILSLTAYVRNMMWAQKHIVLFDSTFLTHFFNRNQFNQNDIERHTAPIIVS